MPSTASKKKYSILPTVLFLLGVLAVGELACRGLDVYDGYKRYHRLLGETAVYRDQVYSISKPKGVKRVLLLGGSAAHDTVKNYQESWPYLLEQKLKKSAGEKIELINMAFYSESSIDELFKLNQFGLDMMPDLVIVFDGSNDVYNLYRQHDYWKKLYEEKDKPILFEKKHHFLTKFAGSIRKKSSLYQHLNLWKRSVTLALTDWAEGMRKQPSSPAVSQAPAPESGTPQASAPAPASAPAETAGPSFDQFFEDESRWPVIQEDYVEIYGSNLEKMAKLIRKTGAKGLFIFQPDLSYKPVLTDQVSAGETAEYLKIIGKHDEACRKILAQAFPKGIELMRKTAETYGLVFYDFNPKILLGGDVQDLFEGNVHFSEKGRERISDELASIILEKKLI